MASLGMLAGCGGGGPADPPTDLAVKAGDGSVTLTWTMKPDVEYWAFYAPASSVSATSMAMVPGGKTLLKQQSPLVIGGLVNGTTYAFTINGRTNGGPGGPGAPSVSAVPRLAGATWTVGKALGSTDLSAITYGALGGNLFMAVGSGGVIASSPDGLAWTVLGNPGSPADLNAVAFGGSSYVALGAGGVILNSIDGIAWTAQASPVSSNLYGLAVGVGSYVGVGANGTLIYSSNGTSWSAVASDTTRDLRAVVYGGNRYVAVGAGGTLLGSTDGMTWTAASSGTSLDLKSVAYGTDVSTGSSRFVAVGASGALVSSTDGITWTSYADALPNSVTANSITYGSQFVLVGDAGIIYTSTTGTQWQSQSSGTGGKLNAVVRNMYGYSAVGSSGANLLSL